MSQSETASQQATTVSKSNFASRMLTKELNRKKDEMKITMTMPKPPVEGKKEENTAK